AAAREPEGWQDEDWDYETQEAFGRTWRDEEPAGADRFRPPPGVPEDAVLLGALHDRGIAMLITADAVLLPSGGLRTGPVRERRPRRLDPRADAGQRRILAFWRRLTGTRVDPKAELFIGAAVDPASLRQPPELPLTARPRVRVRLLGAGMVLAAFAGLPAAVYLGHPDLYALVVVTAGFGQLAAAGAVRLLGYLRLSHHQFEITALWRTYSVPWDRLHGVRRDGAVLSVAWQPDTMIDVGPFDDPGGERGRQDRAEQLGAAMLLQRRRALLGGLPGRATSSRPSPTWLVLALYAALAGAVILLR
ncbi:MAG TPA: hypothetical protein VGX49_13840, partial [Jatrophihabitans sp.]|nr:hypothetical protein [Jatrophihabitans sp.]